MNPIPNRDIDREELSKELDVDLENVNVLRYQYKYGYAIIAFLNYVKDTDVELYVMGKGSWLNKHLLRHFFTFIFKSLNCKRCTARIESKNNKSINLVERLGFVREGELRVIDTYIYSLLRKECNYV